jgi:hypothetical protein
VILLLVLQGFDHALLAWRASTHALDVHLEDDGVVDQAIDGGDHHCLIRNTLFQSAKG